MSKNKAEEGKAPKEEKKKSKKVSATDKLKLEIEELNVQLAESKDKYLRLFAEFDNFKKRTMKERLDILKTASQETISALLPVVSMVYNKIYSVVGNKGLQKMESTGLDFDPELHEAITKIPAPTDDMKGKVIDTIEAGYTLNDKIIRHAKVVVGE